MGEMKPTPGPWEAVMYERGGFDIASKGDDGITICSRIPFRRLAAEMTDNARLIAEAGTVFHNTGLSPVQLVEMVRELKEALCLMVRTHDEPAENLLQEVKEQQWLDKARAALAKCEGVKP